MVKEVQMEILGNKYLVKKTYRSLLLFEEQSGKSVSEMKQSLRDLMMLFYCIVQANNTITFTFPEFVDMIDAQPDAMDKFNEYLVESATEVKEKPAKKK
jgi:hypothetical protein